MKHAAVLLLIAFACTRALSAEPPVDDSHMAAATALLRAMNVEAQMAAGASTMVDLMIQQNPTLAPYKDVVLKWAARFMTWDKFGARLAVMYRDEFTEAELRDLLAFYRSPTGQKQLATMPKLLHEQAELGSMVAMEHRDELAAMIQARTEEISRLTKQN